MKYIFIFVTLFSANLRAQPVLKFDKRFVECEDKWVAFPPTKDSSFPFGFIYIDATAGLTLQYEGAFKISNTGVFIHTTKPDDRAEVIVRLQPNQVHVALIPENKFDELEIKVIPDWLKIYEPDTVSIERLYSWGFMYNGWNECAKALTFLEKAQKINPNYKGLAVELAFSYNCLSQYDKAITVLNSAIQANPTDAYFHKELIYAEVNLGQLDKAAESCKKALAICTDNTQFNGEMCYTLLRGFYYKKDKLNFNLWLNEVKKWAASNELYSSNIKKMEEDVATW